MLRTGSQLGLLIRALGRQCETVRGLNNLVSPGRSGLSVESIVRNPRKFSSLVDASPTVTEFSHPKEAVTQLGEFINEVPTEVEASHFRPPLHEEIKSVSAQRHPGFEPKPKDDRYYRARHNTTVSGMLKLLESAPSKTDVEQILDSKVAELTSPKGWPWIPLFDALQRGPKPYLALEVFNWKKSKIELGDPKEYAKMIATAGKLGQLDLAISLFKDMEAKGVKRSSVTCNALISAYAKSDQPEEALSIFKEMLNSGDCRPTLVTYNTLISMYSKFSVHEMEHYFESLKRAGFIPDRLTYNSMVWGYMRAREFDKMDGLYEVIKMSSSGPDPITFNALIIGYGKADLVEKMEAAFNHMTEEGHPINVLIAELMVENYAYHRNFEKMERIMKLVDNTRDISCSSRIFGTSLKCYAEVGKLDEMTATLEKMFKANRILTSAKSLEAVISAYAGKGLFEDLDKLLHRFESVGWAHQLSTFHTLLFELGKGRQLEKMEEIFQKMQASTVMPTAETYHIIADSYDSSGDEEGLRRTIGRMKAAGFDASRLLEKEVDRAWTDEEIYDGKPR